MTVRLYPLWANSTGLLLDRTTKAPWARAGGDWLDADGVLNGPKPTRQGKGASDTVDISGLGDVFIQGVNSVHTVVVDGVDVTAQCFWLAGTDARTYPLPSLYGNGAIVPYGGKVMTVASNATGSWRVDPVATQEVGELAVDASYYRAPDLLRVDPTSLAALTAPPGSVPAPGIFGGAYSFGTDRGVAIVQAHAQPAPYFPSTGRGRVLRVDYPVGRRKQLNVAWLLRVGADVYNACRDLGIKLGGPTGDENIYAIAEMSCAAAIGGLPNPRNVGAHALWEYFGSLGVLQQSSDVSFARFLADRYLIIEREVIANSGAVGADGKPLADGRVCTLINGVVVQDAPRAWFVTPGSGWTFASNQVYQGGTQSFANDCTFTQGPFMASTQRIGVPPELVPLITYGAAVQPPPVQPDPPPVIVVTDPPPPTEIDNMTPPEVVTLCATAYNAACALAGVPDLPAQLVAAAASSDAVTQANKDRDVALAQAKAAQDALAALKAAIVTEHAAIDAAEADADKAAQA